MRNIQEGYGLIVFGRQERCALIYMMVLDKTSLRWQHLEQTSQSEFFKCSNNLFRD
jgi:hypothetical protein